jgi:ABC-type amino acid transport system permease subunit
MSIGYTISHENYVPAYQTSATPFVTASSVTTTSQVSFPYVTRFFTVQNRSSLEVKGTNYFVVPSGSQVSGEFKVMDLFMSSSTGASINYVVLAGLTGIKGTQFTVPTGSNGYGGVG